VGAVTRAATAAAAGAGFFFAVGVGTAVVLMIQRLVGYAAAVFCIQQPAIMFHHTRPCSDHVRMPTPSLSQPLFDPFSHITTKRTSQSIDRPGAIPVCARLGCCTPARILQQQQQQQL
jgi:hypothetical protein